MSQLGDKCRGTAIGRKSVNYFTYAACPTCGVERWVQTTTLRKYHGGCVKCAIPKMRGPRPSSRGANNAAWKGGRTLMKTGYIRMPIYPDDSYIAMAAHCKNGEDRHYWITEHRYVMAQHLGRCLKSWEVVHHINGDKTDNRIENLEILMGKDSRQTHMAFTLLQQENEVLRKQVAKLEARVTLLEAERILVTS